jgi:hypothetical protein
MHGSALTPVPALCADNCLSLLRVYAFYKITLDERTYLDLIICRGQCKFISYASRQLDQITPITPYWLINKAVYDRHTMNMAVQNTFLVIYIYKLYGL